MKSAIFTLLAAAVVSLGQLQADWSEYIPDWTQYVPGSGEANTYYGPTTLSGEELDEVTIYGPATFTDCIINVQATIAGPLKASKTTFESLHVDGFANLSDVKVVDDFYMNGPLKAKNSSFDSISIASSELTLSHCTVHTLLVRKSGSKKPQVVYLNKGTKIGQLTFETEGGRVIAQDSESTVSELKGGTLDK